MAPCVFIGSEVGMPWEVGGWYVSSSRAVQLVATVPALSSSLNLRFSCSPPSTGAPEAETSGPVATELGTPGPGVALHRQVNPTVGRPCHWHTAFEDLGSAGGESRGQHRRASLPVDGPARAAARCAVRGPGSLPSGSHCGMAASLASRATRSFELEIGGSGYQYERPGASKFPAREVPSGASIRATRRPCRMPTLTGHHRGASWP